MIHAIMVDMQRTETYMTTEKLLREVILNAVAHKYYPSNVPIQIKVSDDHITVMNEGFWPFENLAVEDVYNGEHSSYPRNPTIDNGLFFAGAMDTWGQGFIVIKEECEKTDAPLPEIKATERYVTVTIHGCKKYMELLKGSASSPAIIEEEDTLTRLVEFCSEPRSRKEMMEFMGLTNRDHFSKHYIRPLLDAGRIQMTKPDKPRSSDQKYKKT